MRRVDGLFADVYRVAIFTGMRRSEICGLKWDMVDLDANEIRVTRTLQRIIGKGLVEGQPKTARSRRSISLSPVTVGILQRVRTQLLERKFAYGPAWTDTCYVFTELNGLPIEADRLSKDFASVIRRLELPHLSLHGLRHAHATLMLTQGVHLKVVSERLGHSNIAVTADTYSHVLPGLQRDVALALDELLTGTGS